MNKKFSTATIAKIGLLAAIGFVLSLFEFALPIFPAFLKLDVGSVPAVMGTLALGPAAGVSIELVRNLIDLSKTTSGGIGQLANFIMGSALILPLGMVYRRIPNPKGYIIGAAAGMVSMAIAASFMNYLVLIPMYSRFIPIDAIIEMARLINPIVVDMSTFIMLVIVPFNVIKAVGLAAIGYILYKALRPVMWRLAGAGR